MMASTTAETPAGRARMSPRKRARLIRWVQYAVLAAAIAVFLAFADLGQLQRAFLDPEVIAALFPEVITIALRNTVFYTALGFSFALVVGLVLALMRLSQVAPYRWFATMYIEFFRGLPALLVFLAVGTGVPIAFPGTFLDRWMAIMLALGLVGSAYIAETIRAGIQAVPKGQMEAARSLGMSSGRAMLSIVIPQAFRIILPPLTNEIILLTKDSSLAFILGASLDQQELTQFGRNALNSFRSLTPVLVAGAMYLIITIPLGILVRRLEARQAKSR